MSLLNYKTVSLLIVSIPILLGCNVLKRSKKANKSSVLHVIDSGSIYVNRIESRSRALVKFNTKVPAKCLVKYWSQDENTEPTKEDPKVFQCTKQDQARQVFNEYVKELETDTFYSFEIWAWPENGVSEQAEKIIVHESQSGNITTNDVIVARINLPLHTSEVHQFETALSNDQLKTLYQRKTGCQKSVPVAKNNSWKASGSIGVEGLSTRGFATANALVHPNYKNRFKLDYRNIQYSDSWEWIYLFRGQSHRFISRQGGKLASFQVTSSDNNTQLDPPNLKSAGKTIQADYRSDLQFAWTIENPSEKSYVVVQIGKAGYDQAIYCVFDAAKGMGNIQSSLLTGLSSSAHNIVATFESTQLQVFPGTSQPKWLITSYDWRASKIQRL